MHKELLLLSLFAPHLLRCKREILQKVADDAAEEDCDNGLEILHGDEGTETLTENKEKCLENFYEKKEGKKQVLQPPLCAPREVQTIRNQERRCASKTVASVFAIVMQQKAGGDPKPPPLPETKRSQKADCFLRARANVLFPPKASICPTEK